jgi:hypothetical protein
VAPSAELTVRGRREASRSGEASLALSEGRLIVTSAIRLSDPRGVLLYPRPNGSGGARQRVDDDSDLGFVGREVRTAQARDDDRPGGRRVDLRVGTDRQA